MKTSDSILKIAPAMAKAQAAFSAAIKNKSADMGKFDYSYADLATVLEAAQTGLAPNGLFLINFITDSASQQNKRELETVLMHESGEFFAMAYPLNMSGTPQQIGSELTYARRYSAMMILGIASEDDDGASASGRKPGTAQKPATTSATTATATTKTIAPLSKVTRIDGSSSTATDVETLANETAQDIEAATLRMNAIAFKKKWTDKLNAAFKTHPEAIAMLTKVAAENQAKSDTPTADIIARAKRIMVNVANTTGELEEPAPGESE